MGKLYTALLTLSIIWGTSFLFIKVLTPALGPWGVVFWRCLFGALFLVLVLAVTREKVNWRELPLFWIVMVGLINNVLPFGFIAIGEMSISSSLASVINAMTPISTLFIGMLLFASRVKGMQWVGIILGFSGILVLLQFDVRELAAGSWNGMLMVLAATFCYALGTQLSRRFLGHLSVLVLSASTLLAASVLALPIMLFGSKEGFRAPVSHDTFLSLGGLGVLGSGAAYLLFYYMVKRGSAEFASFVTYLVPLSAMLWGHLLLGEQVTYYMAAGLVLIFSGVYLSNFKKRKGKAEGTAAA
ncbi:DMT family transporter [Ectobacillus ponti]|uniref:DMT family transporter n=1 Tax=Ectobacillus ponti TaxID=2961894 RepID=A0AA41XCC6_9BACI|nr:DMT family transporter [Ectobacillus ponti]MCP8970320.1 DMT family transporter [Ectobacillus ponti]